MCVAQPTHITQIKHNFKYLKVYMPDEKKSTKQPVGERDEDSSPSIISGLFAFTVRNWCLMLSWVGMDVSTIAIGDICFSEPQKCTWN